jgi:hypothetical protein
MYDLDAIDSFYNQRSRSHGHLDYFFNSKRMVLNGSFLNGPNGFQ